ncbi:hypothetical protein ID875_03515 [Streptomyces globisporus]|uniref:Uncharacterized protein n=1 Tax=Streptomyces globisporus TaxID=1908 RepID=A0A927GM91_STRGL|nr:hypothetical protein [Streptomyces globisporus]
MVPFAAEPGLARGVGLPHGGRLPRARGGFARSARDRTRRRLPGKPAPGGSCAGEAAPGPSWRAASSSSKKIGPVSSAGASRTAGAGAAGAGRLVPGTQEAPFQ